MERYLLSWLLLMIILVLVQSELLFNLELSTHQSTIWRLFVKAWISNNWCKLGFCCLIWMIWLGIWGEFSSYYPPVIVLLADFAEKFVLPSSKKSSSSFTPNIEALAMVQSMGFTTEQATKALRATVGTAFIRFLSLSLRTYS